MLYYVTVEFPNGVDNLKKACKITGATLSADTQKDLDHAFKEFNPRDIGGFVALIDIPEEKVVEFTEICNPTDMHYLW